MSRKRSHRDAERLAQGAGAVYPLGRAAELLPMDDKEAMSWLRQSGLVRLVAGREMVVWQDVLDRVRDANPDDERKPVRGRPAPSTLRRSSL